MTHATYRNIRSLIARRYVAALVQEWYNPPHDLSSNRRSGAIFRNIKSIPVTVH